MQNPIEKPVEPVKTCVQCGEKLCGHEDENGTHCRWCVTGWTSAEPDSGVDCAVAQGAQP